MVDWKLGTIGFTYPEWKNSFYPAGLPSRQSLNYYGKVFNALEINTTFYGAPTAGQLQRWADETPPDFAFCLKTPKRITHELRLDASAVPEMCAFLTTAHALESRLGAVLIQLPPSFKANDFDVLAKFLDQLSCDPHFPPVRCAVELRHASWHDAQVAARLVELLASLGMGWVATDYEDLPPVIHPTTSWLYMRWIGKHNVLAHPGYEVVDRQERLLQWIDRLEPHLKSLDTVFGFFDNDYAGHSPGTVQRFRALLGLSDTSLPAEQPRLF